MHKLDDLYEVFSGIDVPEHMPLVAGMSGFADAGGTITQLNEHFFSSCHAELLVKFDTDFFIDYRARRPIMDFQQDHLGGYRPHTLTIHKMIDDMGNQFLYLSGSEPDLLWNRFVVVVRKLMKEFKVGSLVWAHSIPMPVPHTRPLGITVSGLRKDLSRAISLWQPHTQVPVTAMHLLEYELYRAKFDVTGFVLLVPHYLAETEYPAAVISTLDALTAATGLIFPTENLRQADRDLIAHIDEQVAHNAELARLVGALEERYDSFLQDNGKKLSLLVDPDGELPTADEIAAELEHFLETWRKAEKDDEDKNIES